MTGRLEGKVAFITGAERSQRRAHAVRIAAEAQTSSSPNWNHDRDVDRPGGDAVLTN
jgi:hypothetical protein